jgi:hypothetical protein
MLGANSGSDTLEDERHVWIRAPFIMHDERDFVLKKMVTLFLQRRLLLG